METSRFVVFIFLCCWSINFSPCAAQIQSSNSNGTKFFIDLEQLDFRKLIYVAGISEEFSLAAADVFGRKFANRTIEIRCSYDENDVRVYDEWILIEHLDMAVRMLQHFGSHILDLGIDHGIFCALSSNVMNRMKQISTLMEKKCSNLTKLTIASYDWNVLDDVQRVFHTVEDLTFKGKYNKLGSKTLNLNEMFPNVRNLTLVHVGLKDNDSANINLPHLRKLYIAFSYPGRQNKAELKNLIQKNPQIKEFGVGYTGTSYIKFASEHLMNLDILRLHNIINVDYTNEIHFGNVKKFTFLGKIVCRFKNFTFGNLEEFSFNLDEFPIWIDFIRRHRNLKKLVIARSYKITDNELILLRERALNLVDASFACDHDVEVETLVRYLEQSKHLKKLQLYRYGFAESPEKMNDLKDRMEDKWTFELIDNEPQYLIERKNQTTRN